MGVDGAGGGSYSDDSDKYKSINNSIEKELERANRKIESLKKELERLQNCYDILYKKYIEK